MDNGIKADRTLARTAVDAAEKLEGAASLLDLLEEKAEVGKVVTSAELAAVRSVVEGCAKALDDACHRE